MGKNWRKAETKNKQACGYGVLLSANQHLSNQVLFLYQNSERSKTMIDQKFLESLGVTDESAVQKITETYTANIKAEQDAATATKTQLDETNKTIQSLKLSITLDTFPTRIMKRSVRRQPLRRIFAALQQEEAHQWTSRSCGCSSNS